MFVFRLKEYYKNTLSHFSLLEWITSLGNTFDGHAGIEQWTNLNYELFGGGKVGQ